MLNGRVDGFTRRALLAGTAAGASAALVGCERPVDPRVLRLGHLHNVTHAPALSLLESGRLRSALGVTALETRAFNAGPAVIEALLGGAIDVAYVGPSPALAAFIRSRGQALRVVAGVCSGGAGLALQQSIRWTNASALRGRTIATPQLGNTQDVALRAYLAAHGMRPEEEGGDVRVLPLSNAEAFNQFRIGRIDGAWVPEPALSRMLVEARGQLAIDERDLWPARRFATTVLVARCEYIRRAPEPLARMLAAHVREVDRYRIDPAEPRALAARAIARALGRPIPAPVLASAWSRADFTTDPLRESLEQQARHAQAMGFLPHGSLHSLIEGSLLAAASATAHNGAT